MMIMWFYVVSTFEITSCNSSRWFVRGNVMHEEMVSLVAREFHSMFLCRLLQILYLKVE